MKVWDKFSNWQCHLHERHPLACQVATRVIAGVLVVFLLWFAARAKAFFSEARIEEMLGKITLTNTGIFPLNREYTIASDDTVILSPISEIYATLKPTDDEKTQKLYVKNLPGGSLVELTFKGADPAKIKEVVTGNTVAALPPSILSDAFWTFGETGGKRDFLFNLSIQAYTQASQEGKTKIIEQLISEYKKECVIIHKPAKQYVAALDDIIKKEIVPPNMPLSGVFEDVCKKENDFKKEQKSE